jgi:hypothetical protein
MVKIIPDIHYVFNATVEHVKLLLAATWRRVQKNGRSVSVSIRSCLSKLRSR